MFTAADGHGVELATAGGELRQSLEIMPDGLDIVSTGQLTDAEAPLHTLQDLSALGNVKAADFATARATMDSYTSMHPIAEIVPADIGNAGIGQFFRMFGDAGGVAVVNRRVARESADVLDALRAR